MPQWGNNDRSSNSVIWGITGFNGAPNTTNQTSFFRNNTQDAFVTGLTAGQWGVDPTEIAVVNGPVNLVTITKTGSGYDGTTLSAITGGGGSGANVTFTSAAGRITTATINDGGSSYESNPSITIQAPTIRVFNGNTDVTANSTTGAFIALATASSLFANSDLVTYAGNTSSTPVGLTDNTTYYVRFANTTGLKLSLTRTGANLNFTPASGNSTTAAGATLQGEAAEATVVVGGGRNKGVTHAGWVVRTVGTGGRAGRVQYETLVAMGSMSEDIGSDDTVLPDSNT